MADLIQPLSPRIRVVDPATGYLTTEGFQLLQSMRSSITGELGATGIPGVEALAYALIGRPSQPLSAILAALSGLDTTNGLLAQVGAAAFAKRTLQAPAAGLTWTNADGVAGDPTLALADDLAGIEGISGTGMVARNAANTYTPRTITGAANQVTVLNGDGVAGNPTLSLAVGDIVTSSWTPTLTNGANVSSSTAFVSHYLRVGGLVLGGGLAQVTPTAAANTQTDLGISLPVASNFAAVTDAFGVAASEAAQRGARIFADIANDRMTLRFASERTAATNFPFIFGYLII